MSEIIEKLKDGASQAGSAIQAGAGKAKDLASSIDPKTLAAVLGTAGVSGAVGGYLTSQGPMRKTESPTDRRRRILRNALMTAAAGGGAAALGATSYNSFSSALPKGDVDPVTYAITGLPGRAAATGLAHAGVSLRNGGAQESAVTALRHKLGDHLKGTDINLTTNDRVRGMFNTSKVNEVGATGKDAYRHLIDAFGGESDGAERLLMDAGIKPTAARGGIKEILGGAWDKVRHGGPLNAEASGALDQMGKRVRHSLIGENAGGVSRKITNRGRLGIMASAFMYPELMSAMYHAANPSQIFKS